MITGNVQSCQPALIAAFVDMWAQDEIALQIVSGVRFRKVYWKTGPAIEAGLVSTATAYSFMYVLLT